MDKKLEIRLSLTNDGIYYTQGRIKLTINSVSELTRAAQIDKKWSYNVLDAMLTDTDMTTDDRNLLKTYLDTLPDIETIFVPSPFREWWEVSF